MFCSFQRKNCKRKIKFLQCLWHYWCCADSDFNDDDFYDITLMPRFPIGLKNVSKKQSYYVKAKVQRNDWYSLKQNWVREINKYKHYKVCKDTEMSIKNRTPLRTWINPRELWVTCLKNEL